MIMQRAIDDYLSREMPRDLWYFKALPPDEVSRLLYERVGDFKFTTAPYIHQQVCMVIGTRWNRVLFQLDMGTGKTKVALDLQAFFKHVGKGRQMLVLVPSAANVGAWINNAQTHAPHLTVLGLVGSKTDRLETLDTPCDALVMTYAALLRYTTKRRKKKLKRKKSVLMPDPVKIREMSKRFPHVVMDEITLAASSHDSTTTRILYQLSKASKRVYALTGTLFGGDPLDMFSQFKVVDLGETFGPHVGLFRESFFSSQERFFGGFDYKLKKRLKPQLHLWMRNRSIRYEESECNDLPKFIKSTIAVTLPQSTWSHYEKLKEAMKQARQNRKLQTNTYMDARYLCAGFMSLRGEDGTTVEVAMGSNPKLDALIQWLKEKPKDAKAVVFNIYKRTGRLLESELTKAGFKCMRLFSGTPRKQDVERRFNTDPRIEVLICSEAGAYGMNFQAANYEAFYESPSDPKSRKQMEKRCHRTGQTKTVFCTDFVVRGSVDVKILKHLAEGKNLFDSLVDGRETL